MRRIVLLALVAIPLAACGGEEGPADDGVAAGGEVVEIALTDFALDPATLELAPGEYTLRVANQGEATHALKVDGPGHEVETEDLAPGDEVELAVDLTEPGEYELTCPVGNHREQGMEGTLVVGDAGGGTTDGTTTDETTTEDSDYRY